MITAHEVKAARVLLNWSQMEIATASGFNVQLIIDFEAGRRQLGPGALAKIRRALEAAGVEFTNGGQPELRATAKAAISDEAAIGDDPESRGDPYTGSAK